jgi:hypothetical protein
MIVGEVIAISAQGRSNASPIVAKVAGSKVAPSINLRAFTFPSPGIPTVRA